MADAAFTGACALVTGASSGIGRALAVELGRRKGWVALLGRDAGRLSAAKDECIAAGAVAAEAFAIELSDQSAIEGVVRDIETRLARPVDLAIHAAGSVLMARVEDYPIDQAAALLDVNLLAGFALARALIPGMRARGGTIGFISSGSAYRALPYQWAYAASKAGIERLAEALRVELADSPIKIRVVSPGPIDTAMTTNPPTVPPAVSVSGRAGVPSPTEVAPAILDAFAGRRARTEMAMRVRVARWLSAFGAEPFDTLLRRRI